MRSIIKFVFLAGIVLAVTAVLGLFVMSSLARIDGVKTVAVPTDSYISGHIRNADYYDAYRIDMDYSNYANIGDVINNAFAKGNGAIYRTDKEVCFEGEAPGLIYRVSYILERDGEDSALTVSTTVHYRQPRGEWYFFFAMPIHKMVVPYMLDRMAKA